MSSSFTRFVFAAAVAVSGASSGAQAFTQSGTYTPRVEGSGENQSVVRPMDVMGSVQPRAVITGSGGNISVQHLNVPPPTFPGYVAVVVGSGENQSVVHIPAGG